MTWRAFYWQSMKNKPFTYTDDAPLYIPKYAEINGVWRIRATSLSLPSKYTDERMTVPKALLERELRRVIEECMVHGGEIEDLASRCMRSIEADIDDVI